MLYVFNNSRLRSSPSEHKSLQSSRDEGTERCSGQAEWRGFVRMLHKRLASCLRWEAAAPKALRAFWGLQRYGLISMSQHSLRMHSIITVTFAPRRIQPDPSLHHFFLPVSLPLSPPLWHHCSVSVRNHEPADVCDLQPQTVTKTGVEKHIWRQGGEI